MMSLAGTGICAFCRSARKLGGEGEAGNADWENEGHMFWYRQILLLLAAWDCRSYP